MDPLIKGDVNLDGVVDLLDVLAFVDVLSTGTFQAEADCNCDGAVSLLDVPVNSALRLVTGQDIDEGLVKLA